MSFCIRDFIVHPRFFELLIQHRRVNFPLVTTTPLLFARVRPMEKSSFLPKYHLPFHQLFDHHYTCTIVPNFSLDAGLVGKRKR